jgi:hypothetical protein
MLQREQQRRVRLGIELEADALLSISGVQAYSIALKRAEEASSDEMVCECRRCDSCAQVGGPLISARRIVRVSTKSDATFMTKRSASDPV